MAGQSFDVSQTALEIAMVKITYLGEQEKTIATVILFTDPAQRPLEAFSEVPNEPIYSNDAMPQTQWVQVTAETLTELIIAVEPTMSKRLAGVVPDFLSFTVVSRTNDLWAGREFCIGRARGQGFYRRALDVLASRSPTADAALRIQRSNVFPD